jgi:hypothetical protein
VIEMILRKGPSANPTTLSYNASVVKMYSATNSMARFIIKIAFF